MRERTVALLGTVSREALEGILAAASRAAGQTCEIAIAEREGLACWYELQFA